MRRIWIIATCLAVASVSVLAENYDDDDGKAPYFEVDSVAEDGLKEGDEAEAGFDPYSTTEDRHRRRRELSGSNAYPGYAAGFGSRSSADAFASGFAGAVSGYQTGLGGGSSANAFAGSSSFSGGRTYPATGATANAFANTHVRYAAPVVQKHFYYHAAPEEHKATAQAETLTITPRKHYKVIFIKAPSVSADAGAAARAASQVEEKTIVYVLTNKPSAKANAGAQADASTFSSGKPEVYFIKYQGNDAQAVAKSSASGVAGYGGSNAYSGASSNAGFLDGGFGARSGAAYPSYDFGSPYSGAGANAGSSAGGFGARSGASSAAGSVVGAYPGYAPSSSVFF